MNALLKLYMHWVAGQDARRGVFVKEKRVDASLGLAPQEVEAKSLSYRRSLSRAADTGRRDDLQEVVQGLEKRVAEEGSASPYTLLLVVVWVVEFAGAIFLLKTLGLPAAHRVLPALGLTMALVFLTRWTVEAMPTPMPSSTTKGGSDE